MQQMKRSNSRQLQKQSRARKQRRGLAGLVAVSTAFGVLINATPAAAANITDGFNPGNIIEDAEFYNGYGMSAQQVQDFLNQRVPQCTIGRAGRKPGTAARGSQVADRCLRDFVMATTSKPATQYCRAYSGSTSESAASIIAKVGEACSINPRVLLVMLEKEQSLVTHSWPTRRQLNVAMGYACPDSGPNFGANCDASYYGFFNQVYNAAQQLQRYKQHPERWRYRPHVVNTVQYHPNPACGTSRFVIENSATAALYIYTPYRPNAAALAAGWGTGDSCSAYGNRNFFNFYKSWFGYVAGRGNGSPTGYYPTGGFAIIWNAAGGANSVYGYPTGPEYRFPNGTVTQQFQNGAAVWSEATGAFFVSGAIRGRYLAEGGVTGKLGLPISAEYDTSNGRGQQFQNGEIRWYRNGGTTVHVNAPASTPGYTRHSNGFETGGAIGTLWSSLGGAGSIYGLPTGNEQNSNGTVTQDFQNGVAVWSNGTGAHFVSGAIRSRYIADGGVTGKLGLPISAEYDTATGRGQKFQHGEIRWYRNGGTTVHTNDASSAPTTPATPAPPAAVTPGYTRHSNGFETGGAIGGLWTSLGGAKSIYGMPTGNEQNSNGTVTQEFKNGVAVWSNKTGAFFVSGAIRSRYITEGGVTGKLGLPISAEYDTATGRGQKFQHGEIRWYRNGGTTVHTNGTPATPPTPTAPAPAASTPGYTRHANGFETGGAIGGLWTSLGGAKSIYGLPTGNEYHSNGVVTQQFQNGAAVWSSRTGAFFVNGAIRGRYLAEGGVTGRLGLPISAEYDTATGRGQKFQHGEIRWYRNGGTTIH